MTFLAIGLVRLICFLSLFGLLNISDMGLVWGQARCQDLSSSRDGQQRHQQVINRALAYQKILLRTLQTELIADLTKAHQAINVENKPQVACGYIARMMGAFEISLLLEQQVGLPRTARVSDLYEFTQSSIYREACSVDSSGHFENFSGLDVLERSEFILLPVSRGSFEEEAADSLVFDFIEAMTFLQQVASYQGRYFDASGSNRTFDRCHIDGKVAVQMSMYIHLHDLHFFNREPRAFREISQRAHQMGTSDLLDDLLRRYDQAHTTLVRLRSLNQDLFFRDCDEFPVAPLSEDQVRNASREMTSLALQSWERMASFLSRLTPTDSFPGYSAPSFEW